jgi:hypothetical protein
VLALQVIFLTATNGLPGSVILQQDYSRCIPLKSTAPAALVEGWNQALVEILANAASDFESRKIGAPSP